MSGGSRGSILPGIDIVVTGFGLSRSRAGCCGLGLGEGTGSLAAGAA